MLTYEWEIEDPDEPGVLIKVWSLNLKEKPHRPLPHRGYCPNLKSGVHVFHCHACSQNQKEKSNLREHLYWVPGNQIEWSYAMGTWIKKPDATSATQEGAVTLSKGDSEKYAALIEFLGLETYEDGSKRQTGTMTLFLDGSGLKACLNDRDTGRTGWATAESFTALLGLLERQLREAKVEWRAAKPGNWQQKKGGQRR